MRRAALALLLAAALAAPAAAKSLIITPPTPTISDMYQLTALKEMLVNSGQREGIEFKVVNFLTTTTLHARRGVFYNSPTDSVLFEVVHVLGFSAGRYNVGGTPLLPDSLGIVGGSGAGQRKFALKTTVFWARTSGTRVWSSSGPPCSLGVIGAALINAAGARDTTYSSYAVGSPYVFKLKGQSIQPKGTVKAGAYFRQRINIGASLAQTLCLYCDSLVTRAANDSLVAWEYSAIPPGVQVDGQTAASILCVNGGDTNSQSDEGLMFYALCVADSLSGGKVFERRVAEPGGRGLPFQMSALVSYGYKTDGESFLGNSAGGNRSTSATIMKGQADSTNKLRCKPTLVVEADSLDENSWQDAVWSRIGDIHYLPSGHAGIAGAANFGNASASHPMDSWGRSRARFAFGDHSGRGKDTSSTALFSASRKLCETKWGKDKVEPLIAGSGYSWAPSAANAAMTKDSLYAAVAAADFTGVLTGSFTGVDGFGGTLMQGWPSTHVARYGFSSDSATSRASSLYGGRRLRILTIIGSSTIASDRYANSQVVTDVARGYGERCVAQMLLGRTTLAPDGGDVVGAALTGNRRCKLCQVTAAGFGKADLGFGAVQRPGQFSFLALKRVDMMIDLWNASVWPANRPVAEWAYPSELR